MLHFTCHMLQLPYKIKEALKNKTKENLVSFQIEHKYPRNMFQEDLPFYCPHCNFLSEDKTVMINHRYDHSRQSDNSLNKDMTITQPKMLPYFCNKCVFFC